MLTKVDKVRVSRQFRRFNKRFEAIFRNPFFWALTILGNAIMVFGSFSLMLFEKSQQARPLEYIDYLLWSAGLMTTIGYGDYMAQSSIGKLIILVMMLLGTLFIWSYMAFLVTGLFAPELASLEKDFREFEKEVHDLKMATDGEKNGQNSDRIL